VLATNVSLPLSPENIIIKNKNKIKYKIKYKDPAIYYLIYGFGKERTKKKESKQERKKERENKKNIRSFANEPTRQTIVFRAAGAAGAAGPPCPDHTFVFYLPSFNFIIAKAGNSLVGSTNPFHFFFPSSFSFPS
jgi:hypothetical protein